MQKKSDYYYDLPPELIAQNPTESRDGSRLLCVDRYTGALAHRQFRDLPELLREGDCLVLNDSRVLPARLHGRRVSGGAVEVVLLRERERGLWECLTRPGNRTRAGTHILFGGGELTADIEGDAGDGVKLARFTCDGDFHETLHRLGKTPLPPYIRAELADSERYQTVYSRVPGSAAAPTAGLHFTRELLERAEGMGVAVRYITLHVGLGTFRPVRAENIEEHEMHSESYVVPEDTAAAINATRASGGRVIAVGTTSCRALESAADPTGRVTPRSGDTDIFIYPGYEFKCIDGLLTNFHLPESTLIMLVSALAGRETIMRAYAEAIRERYRFFSLGDAVLVV